MVTSKELSNLYQMLLKAEIHSIKEGGPLFEMVEGKDAAGIVWSYLERSWGFENENPSKSK